MFNKLIVCLILSLSLTEGAPYISDSSNTPVQHPSVDHTLQVLFIQSAKEAVITKEKNNTYTLTLRHPNPDIAFVSERPIRTAGKTSIQSFISSFNQGQSQTDEHNPNASLVINNSTAVDPSPRASSQLIVLSTPRISNDAISYTIHPQQNSSMVQEGTYQNPVLFIDNNCLWICK